MGINRIKLQNGAMVDPRMKQTYQQNIAQNRANQAARARELQIARARLPGYVAPQRIAAPTPTPVQEGSLGPIGIPERPGLFPQPPSMPITQPMEPPKKIIQPEERVVKKPIDIVNFYEEVTQPGGPADDMMFTKQPVAPDPNTPIEKLIDEPIDEIDMTTPPGTPSGDGALTVMPQYNDPLPQDQLMAGFKEYVKNNPYSGAGTTAIIPVTLPGGYNFAFSGSQEANAFRKYLESIGQAPYQGRRQPGDLAKIEGGLAKLAGGGRVGYKNGSPAEMAKAQEAATSDPALNAIRQQLFGENYIQDIGSGEGIAQYYSGFGLPQSLQFTQPAQPGVDTATPVIDGGGEGGGGGAPPPISMFTDTTTEPGNTAEQQRLIDAGIGVQLEPGSPVSSPYEGMPPTQDEMDAFNQIPVNREYGEPMNIGYGEGQVDPSLAAAVGGVDTTPIDLTGNIQVEDFSKPFSNEVGITGKKVSYPGDQSGTIAGRTNIQDLPQVRTITDGQDNVYDAATGKLLYNKYEYQGQFQPDEGTIFDDSSELGYQISEKAKSAFEKVKSGALNTSDYVKEFGQNVFDRLSAGLSNYKPIIASLLEQIEPASGRQQKLVADQFAEEGVQFDNIGRIKQVGSDYDTPENVMAGYNPGATGLQIGDMKIGGGIIQESIVSRLATLEKTKNKKYGGSFYNADGTPKNNPDTGLPTKLGQREQALKENLNTVARAAGAVTLDGPQYTTNPNAEGYAPFSDTLQAGTTTFATDYFPELGQEESAPNIITPLKKPDVAEDVIQEVNTIAGNDIFVNTITGEVYPDEVLAREDLETSTLPDQPPGGGDASMFYETPTPDNIIANTGNAFDYFNDVNISRDAPTTVDNFDNFDDFEVSGDAAPITGDSASDSFFNAVDNAAAAQTISTDEDRGRGQPDSTPKSKPQQSGPTYSGMGSIGSGGGGGNNDPGGGGTHCCTAANERGDMTLLEVKKLRVWHRKQSKIWQRGYDVWGRVMADNLVSKYKWSSDRVRDFYNHKIYGKRTIGSTFADFCIYPMSMIIGFILTVMPPILGYQKQENKNAKR